MYIQRMPNDINGKSLKSIISGIDINDIEYFRELRNNLHYNIQESIKIGDEGKLLDMLKKEIEIVYILLRGIREILNINPSKKKLLFYKFLRWVQMPSKK